MIMKYKYSSVFTFHMRYYEEKHCRGSLVIVGTFKFILVQTFHLNFYWNNVIYRLIINLLRFESKNLSPKLLRCLLQKYGKIEIWAAFSKFKFL
jgi:hypothetical protein